VPPEVPTGRAKIVFFPATAAAVADGVSVADDGFAFEGECPICAANRDPVTGNPHYNAETIAAFEEGDAMLRGEIPATWHKSLEDLDKMLEL